jgi:O-antigen/teichoic acid export membrane protein
VSIVLLFQDLGVGSAITRFCARNRLEGSENDPRVVAQMGLFCIGFTSAICSLGLYLFAGQIATSFLHDPNLEFMVKAVSFTVFGNGIYNACGAIFVGFEMMRWRSILQIIWSLLRGCLALFFIYMGLSAYGAVLSYMLGFVMSGMLGLIFVIYFIKIDFLRWPKEGFNILKNMLVYSFPVYLGDLVSGLILQWNNSLMTLYVSTSLIGNYTAALNFVVVISFFTATIGTMLFPMFSRLKKDEILFKDLFSFSIKYTHLVVTPVVLILMVVSDPLIRFIYDQNYPYTSLFLKLYLIMYLFEGVGETVINYALLGLGETKVVLISNIITLVIGAPLAYYLIPKYEIIGMISVLIIAPQFGWVFKYLSLKRETKVTIIWKNSIKVYFISILSAIISYLSISYFNDNFINIFLGMVVFFISYLILLSISKTLTLKDIDYLTEISKSAGPISPILKTSISFMKKLILF